MITTARACKEGCSQCDRQDYRLAIVGSRSYNNYLTFESYMFMNILKKYGKPSLVISGGADGTDTMGVKWANQHNIPTMILRPQWKDKTTGKLNMNAAFERNIDIVQAADRVIAFWNEISKGTKHSIDEGKKYVGTENVIVIKVQPSR